MASTNPHGYNVTVRQVVFDGEVLFEARVKELPDARDYAESAAQAYDLAIDTIETSAAIFAQDGRPFPPPTSPQDDFSGRVTLRLPKSLHRRLAVEAESEGVSLNQHLVNVLSYDAGSRTVVQSVPSDEPPPIPPTHPTIRSSPGGGRVTAGGDPGPRTGPGPAPHAPQPPFR